MARNLFQQGHSVTVLTGKPNYPEGIFHKGYRPLVFTKNLEAGIRIFRTPIIRRGRKNKFLLFLNYAVLCCLRLFLAGRSEVSGLILFIATPFTHNSGSSCYSFGQNEFCSCYFKCARFMASKLSSVWKHN